MSANDFDNVYRDFLRESSHFLRSPLGVVKGVIEDQLHGYQCALEDFQSAEHSLATMQSVLNLFRFLSAPPKIEDQINLKEFLVEQEKIALLYNLHCSSYHALDLVLVQCDPVYLSRVLEIVFLLFSQKGYQSYLVEREKDQGTISVKVEGDVLKEFPSIEQKCLKDNISLGLKEKRLQELTWKLIEKSCSFYGLRSCQYQDSEKNTHFNFSF